MNDERFNKHYVKILNKTLTETLLRNVQMQAQAEFVDELIGELQNENESLKRNIQELGEELQHKLRDISILNGAQAEAENIKHQLSHLDTFRNALIEERAAHAESLERITELEDTLSQLQSPAKTKSKKVAIIKPVTPEDDASVKDGGTF